jgi:hypothetical protein
MALGLLYAGHAWGYGYAAMGSIKIDSYLRQLVLPYISDSDRCPKTEKNFLLIIFCFGGMLTSFSVLLK